MDQVDEKVIDSSVKTKRIKIAIAGCLLLMVVGAGTGLVIWKSGDSNVADTAIQAVETVDMPEKDVIDDQQPITTELQDNLQEESDLGSTELALEKYVHPQLGFTIDIPSDWDITTTPSGGSRVYDYIRLTSPDYIFDSSAAFGAVISGAEFGINCFPIKSVDPRGTDYPSIDDILMGNIATERIGFYGGPNGAEKTIIDGREAARYTQSYEGPPSLITNLQFDGVTCEMTNALSTTGELEEYDKFIDSFRFP